MKRAIVVLMVCFIALVGCTQRMICPAYQSAFIYDKEALRKKFSYFNEDSTPKVLMASKTKYLIAEPVSYQKKIRTMETVEMKPIFPVVPDSLRDDYVSEAELDSAARSIIDSTYIVDVDQHADSLKAAEDTVYVITKDKELRYLKYDPDSMKYSIVEMRLNVDQDNYMWYLREVLILPDVRIAKMQEHAGDAKAKKAKKGFFGFLKNLFKRKKDKMDSTVVPVKSAQEFDYVDTLQTSKPVVSNEKTKKKGFFSFLKRNKKAKADQPEAETPDVEQVEEKPVKNKKAKKKKNEEVDPTEPDPAKKEEEKSDGF